MSEQDDGYLYHYTTGEGLLGIVKAREIWATNIFYLNDRREFRHGLAIALQELKKLWADVPTPYKEKADALVDLLKDMDTKGPSFQPWQPYVSCFSEKGDDLSQWRAYCPRGGYALGFSRPKLETFASRHMALLVQCFYDEAEVRKGTEGIVRQFPPRTSDAKPTAVAADVIIQSLRAKHVAFKDENEWRLVRMTLAPEDSTGNKAIPNFRSQGSVLVPYKRLTLDDDDLWDDAKVIIGPSAYPTASAELEALRASVEMLLSRCAHANVRLSSIPYRRW